MTKQTFSIETDDFTVTIYDDDGVITFGLTNDVAFRPTIYPFTQPEARQIFSALQSLLTLDGKQPGTDYIARLYFTFRGETYRFKVFPNIVTVERQSPKSGPNFRYERDAGAEPYDEATQAWDFGILRILIDKYARQEREG